MILKPPFFPDPVFFPSGGNLNALFIVPVRLRADGVVGDPSPSSISSFVRLVMILVEVEVVGNEEGGGSIEV